MSPPMIGFFVGALPGVVFALLNMWRMKKRFRSVSEAARKEGQDIDVYLHLPGQWDLVRNREALLWPADSEDLRLRKVQLLEQHARFVRRHVLAAAMVLLGALGASFCAMLLFGMGE